VTAVALQDVIRAELNRALDKAELNALRHAMFPRKERHFSHCAYCGRQCWGRACPSHRDLVQLETSAT
jgi:hypothetical protein